MNFEVQMNENKMLIINFFSQIIMNIMFVIYISNENCWDVNVH